MPRVNRQTKSKRGAERSCGKCGLVIQPGEEYLKWSFRYGGTRYRCARPECAPRPSDLTQSKMSEVYAAVEAAQDDLNAENVTALAETAQQVAEEYREAAEPFGGEGENAERAEELEQWAMEVEDKAQELTQAAEEAEEVVGGCPL